MYSSLNPIHHAFARTCVCRISAGKPKEVSLLQCFVLVQLVSVIVGYTAETLGG